jgi:hypothetical protein
MAELGDTTGEGQRSEINDVTATWQDHIAHRRT